MTPMCAYPRAPPPPKANETVGAGEESVLTSVSPPRHIVRDPVSVPQGTADIRAGLRDEGRPQAVESGLPLKSDDEQTLRDLMAVHWARSRAIMTARDAITEGIVEDSKRKTLEARPHLLVQAYLTEVGLIPTTSAQLEWINDLVHGRVVAAGEDQWHSERNVVNLGEARKMFARSAIQVGFTPPGSELVLGDAPVLVMKDGDPGVGPPRRGARRRQPNRHADHPTDLACTRPHRVGRDDDTRCRALVQRPAMGRIPEIDRGASRGQPGDPHAARRDTERMRRARTLSP
jgi:hypothetical protein